MTYQIIKYPDPILRAKAEPIARVDDEIRRLAGAMSDLMYRHRGVGLAAPQVGVARRLIVIDCDYSDGNKNLYVLINPAVKSQRGKTTYEEGCLSIPGFYTTIARAQEVVVTATDLEGQPLRIETGGLFAIVLQHEIDHLNGVLILDYLDAVERARVAQLISEGHYERELARSRK